MENLLRLYHTLIRVLRKHRNWLGIRHPKTLAWMMTGLNRWGTISLAAWVSCVCSRAMHVQGTVHGFTRWLDNGRIKVLSWTLSICRL